MSVLPNFEDVSNIRIFVLIAFIDPSLQVPLKSLITANSTAKTQPAFRYGNVLIGVVIVKFGVCIKGVRFGRELSPFPGNFCVLSSGNGIFWRI